MKNKSLISVWKPQGWTPLKAVGEFKNKSPSYKNEKISYAGRLDPMAEGVLLLLVGEENKKRKKYENLPKAYEAEIILGISTDSFDALGIINNIKLGKFSSKEKIEICLARFIGKQNQVYPPYSSKTINGKSLIWWTKKNRLSEIEIPERHIEIYSLILEEVSLVQVSKLYNQVEKKISRVEGNFRQNEILKLWEEFLKKYKEKKVQKVKIKASCSTGTYIRRLASDVGDELNSGGFALSIIRPLVGKHSKKDCIVLD